MATIRTTCPECGEVDLTPESVMVSVHGDSGEGSYRFTCPRCTAAVEKRADRRIVALLRSVGVDVESDGPVEGLEALVPPPESRPGGPVFTPDDLIAFHFQLQDDRAVETELASLA